MNTRLSKFTGDPGRIIFSQALGIDKPTEYTPELKKVLHKKTKKFDERNSTVHPASMAAKAIRKFCQETPEK